MNELLRFSELKEANLLPSPQGVRLNIMRLCQRPDVSLAELVRQIQGDPVLSGRLLKMANVINTNKHRPFAGVTTEVLILVGIQAVRLMALGLSLTSAYSQGACKEFDYDSFWSRSVAMACAAKAVGERIRLAPVGEMFTCGLLTGVGRLGLATVRPQAYGELVRLQGGTAKTLREAETVRFGLHHLQLTAEMMTDWRLPRLFIDAVLHHQSPAHSGFLLGSRQQRLVESFALASVIADICVASEGERSLLLDSLLRNDMKLDIFIELETKDVLEIAVQASRDWQDWGQDLQVRTGSALSLPLEQLPDAL